MWSTADFHLKKCSRHVCVRSGYVHVFLDTNVWSSVVMIVSGQVSYETCRTQAVIIWYAELVKKDSAYVNT